MRLKPESFGFRITFDFTLPLLFISLAWALGFQYFPRLIYGGSVGFYSLLGIVSSASVIASILFHEFGHALAARYCGLAIERIHLYALGGMAELKHRPTRASDEMLVAVSGPLFSLLAAGFGWLISPLITSGAWSQVLSFFSLTNLLLALFNLFPVYPLDGGRLLRSLLWNNSRKFTSASRLTYRISSIILALMCVCGLALLVLEEKPLVYWVAIWLFYLGYMTLRGKSDLLRVPDLTELIRRISPDEPLHSVREELIKIPGQLEKALVPVFVDRHFAGLISGKTLHQKTEVLLLDQQPGMLIDLARLETYSPSVKFEAEILPVFDENSYLGLADAHELRFWLLEGFHQRIRDYKKG